MTDQKPKLYIKSGRRYLPRTDIDHLLEFCPHTMLIAATRYYMGRTTIHASYFAKHELAVAWPRIPQHTQQVIRRDLEEAFKDDDASRARGDTYRPLGMDCDREAWECVRRAWESLE